MKAKRVKYCVECNYQIPEPSRGRMLCRDCFVSRMNRKPGDEAFEVEWCYELPCVPGTNDCDIDRAKFRRYYAKTEKNAIEMAKRQLSEDKFGAVQITPVRWIDQHEETPYAGLEYHWEVIGDSQEVSNCDIT